MIPLATLYIAIDIASIGLFHVTSRHDRHIWQCTHWCGLQPLLSLQPAAGANWVDNKLRLFHSGMAHHLPPLSNSACVEGLHLHRCSRGTPDSCT